MQKNFKTFSSPIPRGELQADAECGQNVNPQKNPQSQNQHSRGFWLSTKYLDSDQINAKRLKKKSVNMYTTTMQYTRQFCLVTSRVRFTDHRTDDHETEQNINYYVKAITNNKRRGALKSSISCNTADETKLTHSTDPRGTEGLGNKAPDKNRQNRLQR